MTGNLFDNAKFGDMFLTTENKQAVFLRFAENAEYKFAILYVEDWGHVQVFRHNGKEVFNDAAHSIISKQEEPVSEDLEKASKEWLAPQLDKSYANYGEDKMMELTHFDGYAMLDAIEFGAKWQAEQFEKNRLKHCDALTEEQAQIESDFVTQHLKENNRTPTFIDAIEYGMRLKEEQMMKDAIEREVKIDADGYPYIDCDIEFYDYDKDIPLAKKGDKVKVIAIKED